MQAQELPDPVEESRTHTIELPPAVTFKISSYEEDRHAENYSHMEELQRERANLDYETRANYDVEAASRKRYATDWEHVRTTGADEADRGVHGGTPATHGGLVDHNNL